MALKLNIRLPDEFRRGLTLTALVPVLILLLLANIIIWRVLVHANRQILETAVAAAATEMDVRLSAEVARLRVLGGLPNTENILIGSTRADAPKRQPVEEMKELWPTIPRDDIRVREVLDSTVGEMFRRIAENNPRASTIFLTDQAGVVLAASERPAAYEHLDHPAWRRAREEEGTRVAANELSAESRLELAFYVERTRRSDVIRGVLREDLDAAKMIEGLVPSNTAGDVAVMLVGGGRSHVQGGAQALGEAAAAAIAARVRKNDLSGWTRGYEYRAILLDAGLAWVGKTWLVVVRKESPFPPGLYGSMAASILISIVLAIVWTTVFRAYYKRELVGSSRDLLEAGDWILRTALGRATGYTQAIAKQGGGKMGATDLSPIQKDLQKWLHMLLQDLQSEYTARQSEMQRDLSLARDFQMAYLDRAYPVIPAVHVEGRIRLGFYHRYEPALALGGDFYNLLTLAPDCAGVFIADVMGHGTRSALITAIIRTLIDDLAPQGRNARHFLTEMNKQFHALLKSVPSPLFASAFYFVADTTARVATFSSAGHPAPFHVRRSVGRVTRLEVPMPRGAALGILPQEQYTGGQTRLIDGDLFVFFTDGVYEAHDIHGEEFGIARMEKIIQRLMYKSAREIVDGLMDGISSFVSYETIADDICIVAVEVTTKPA